MIAPAWFLVLIIIVLFAGLVCLMLRPFIKDATFSCFFEEWVVPAVILGILAVIFS